LENYFGNIQNGKIAVKLSTEAAQNVQNAGANVMPSVNNMQGVSANVAPNANNMQGVSANVIQNANNMQGAGVNANLSNDEKNSQGISTKSSNDGQEKNESKENSEKNNNKGSSNQKENKVEVADFWGKVIDSLKAERQPMLYSNLLNTKGVILDDMTFGIQFPNGLNSFGKSIIEKPENMSELKRLVSIECKKDMRIKLIDNKNAKSAQQPSQNGLAGLGINVNIIN
jgi:hypothetical protein